MSSPFQQGGLCAAGSHLSTSEIDRKKDFFSVFVTTPIAMLLFVASIIGSICMTKAAEPFLIVSSFVCFFFPFFLPEQQVLILAAFSRLLNHRIAPLWTQRRLKVDRQGVVF